MWQNGQVGFAGYCRGFEFHRIQMWVESIPYSHLNISCTRPQFNLFVSQIGCSTLVSLILTASSIQHCGRPSCPSFPVTGLFLSHHLSFTSTSFACSPPSVDSSPSSLAFFSSIILVCSLVFLRAALFAWTSSQYARSRWMRLRLAMPL